MQVSLAWWRGMAWHGMAGQGGTLPAWHARRRRLTGSSTSHHFWVKAESLVGSSPGSTATTSGARMSYTWQEGKLEQY